MKHRLVFVSSILTIASALWAVETGAGRQLLWRTVEVCLLDHRLLGMAAPCLAVETKNGIDSGYVILRSPLDRSHVVLSPTIDIIGIEAPELRRPNAPPYVADAWANRRFAFPQGHPDLPADDIGLAINSQRGRTQNQLHIHVDCLLPDVKDRIATAGSLGPPGQWTQIGLVDGEPPYSATALASKLGASNVIDLSASHLKLSDKEMPLLTLAVVARRNDPENPGFVLLARKDFYKEHAELLLDHDCADHLRLAAAASAR